MKKLINKMSQSRVGRLLALFKRDKRGVTAIEYALIAVTMAGVVTVALIQGNVKNGVEAAFKNVTGSFVASNKNPTAGFTEAGNDKGK